MHWSRTERRMIQWAGPGEWQPCHADLWWMREKSISHLQWGEVKCKERCTRSLWPIHLEADKLSKAAVLRRREKELKNQIHYVEYNLRRKYQNMSAASKRGGWGRGGEFTDGICQLLNQAWRQRDTGLRCSWCKQEPSHQILKKARQSQGHFCEWNQEIQQAQRRLLRRPSFPCLKFTCTIPSLCVSHFYSLHRG